MIVVESKNILDRTIKFLGKQLRFDPMAILDQCGKDGVEALRLATPVDTGLTSSSWTYIVKKNQTGYSIIFKNSNVVNGIPIAIILQYGHGTGTGGYVEGIDYINPALAPIFNDLAQRTWKEIQ